MKFKLLGRERRQPLKSKPYATNSTKLEISNMKLALHIIS